MSELYEQVCNLFIRPTRQYYNQFDLGNPVISSTSRRADFEVTNPRGHRLKASYYHSIEPLPKECVVYLHSLNGSRLESTKLASQYIRNHIGFISFDFSGCGNSQGEYISLGFHQKNDVAAVIQYAHQKYGLKKFSLWGRSMGAVTALKYAEYFFTAKTQTEYKLYGLVLDSPYCSLNRLALEIASARISLPAILLKAALMIIKNTIETKAKFSTEELELANRLDKIMLPLMILVSKEDSTINYKHSEQIYSRYPGEKQIIYVKGEHNQPRDAEYNDKIFAFMKRNFEVKVRTKSSISIIKEGFMNKYKKQINSMKNSESTKSNIKPKSKTPTHSPFGRDFTAFSTQQDQPVEKNLMIKMRKRVEIIPFENKQINSKIYTDNIAHSNIITEKLKRMNHKSHTINIKDVDFKKIKIEDINNYNSNTTLQIVEAQQNSNPNKSEKLLNRHEQQTIDPPKQSFRKVTIVKDFRNTSLIKCTKKPDLSKDKNRQNKTSFIKNQSPIKSPKQVTISLKNPIYKIKEPLCMD